MKFSCNSLPVRLSLVLCSALLVLFIIGVSWLGYIQFSNLTRYLNDQAMTYSESVAFDMNDVFVQGEQIGQLLATSMEITSHGIDDLPEYIHGIVTTMQRTCPALIGICIAYQNGILVKEEKYNAYWGFVKDSNWYRMVHLNTELYDYFYQDWYILPLTLQKPIWTLPYRPDIPGVPWDDLMFSYSIPFYQKDENNERQLAGVIAINVQVDALVKYLCERPFSDDVQLTKSSRIFLMNQFGHIVISPDNKSMEMNKSIFSLCDEPLKPDPRDREMARSIIHGEPTGKIALRKAPLLDTPCDLFYTTCSNRWIVGIAIPSHWIRGTLMPFFYEFLAGWFFLLCLIVFIIFMVCRRFSKPLVTLAGVTEEIGKGNFLVSIPPIKTDDEVGRLAVSMHKMQEELVDYVEQLKKTVAIKERAEAELQVAKRIQQSILPQKLPPFPGFEVISGSAVLIAAKGVGGDLYDTFVVDDDRLAIIIGDVSGKGVPAALFMAVTESLQRCVASSTVPVERIVQQLNELLCANNSSGMFVTYWFGLLDQRTGHLVYTNAGHNPPYLRRTDGRLEELNKQLGIPLGISDDYPYKSGETQLFPKDMIVLYTDGITEAFNVDKDIYGDSRLIHVLKNSRTKNAEDQLQEIEDSVFSFVAGAEQSDDFTLLVFQYSP